MVMAFIVFPGYAIFILQRYFMTWNVGGKTIYRLKFMHKWLGRIMIFACQIESLLGILDYYTAPYYFPTIAVFHFSIFFIVMAMLELNYQRQMKAEDLYKVDDKKLNFPVVSAEEF
jgi:hypothetical protein